MGNLSSTMLCWCILEQSCSDRRILGCVVFISCACLVVYQVDVQSPLPHLYVFLQNLFKIALSLHLTTFSDQVGSMLVGHLVIVVVIDVNWRRPICETIEKREPCIFIEGLDKGWSLIWELVMWIRLKVESKNP